MEISDVRRECLELATSHQIRGELLFIAEDIHRWVVHTPGPPEAKLEALRIVMADLGSYGQFSSVGELVTAAAAIYAWLTESDEGGQDNE